MANNLNITKPDNSTVLVVLAEKLLANIPAFIDGFFTKSDDFLFKLAENSGTGVGSNDYFDQLRLVRRVKKSLSAQMITAIRDWAHQGAVTNITALDEDGLTIDHLDLMDDNVLDASLAVDNFSTRVLEYTNESWPLYQQRVKLVLTVDSITEHQTPFNAKSLGQCFLEQLAVDDLPFKTQLMLFSIFTESATNLLSAFYDEANQLLVDEGFLPDLDLKTAQRKTRSTIDHDALKTIGARLSSTGIEATDETSGNSVPTVVGNQVLVDTELLSKMVSAMTTLQAQEAPSENDFNNLKQWTSAQAAQLSSQMRGTTEDGTVSLVGLLFEHILNEQTLSAHMKQLLARLQIPIIKVAILDKGFFTDTNHSARILLNKMAQAAMAWQPDANISNDVLLNGMERIVNHLNHNFKKDITIFDKALNTFSKIHDKYQHLLEKRAEPLHQNEDHKFVQFQNQDRAGSYIDSLIAQESLPEQLHEMITVHWRDVMNRIFDRQGEGKDWATSIRIVRELIWSMQPNVQLFQRSRFDQVIPKILDSIEKSLKTIGLASDKSSQYIRNIQNFHNDQGQTINEEVWEAQQRIDDYEARADQAEATLSSADILPVDEPDLCHESEANIQKYITRVESLTLGRWFDIKRANGEFDRACLSQIIGDGQKYIFTNFLGDKISERSTIGLAMSLKSEQFKLVDNNPLIDRMFDTLITELDH